MGALQGLRRRLSAKSGVDSYDPESVYRLIVGDRYLCTAYENAYRRLSSFIPQFCDLPVVEIGAGSGISKLWFPEWVTTDLIAGPRIDLVMNASAMPFGEASVRAIVMKDALHHLPDPALFFSEAERVLCDRGVIAMIEPDWDRIPSLLYRYLHPEPFDKAQKQWRTGAGAWESNQALPWIIFCRDRREFDARFPSLEVVDHGRVIGYSYVLSGGVFGRTPIPSAILTSILQREERHRWFVEKSGFGRAITLTRVIGN